MYSISIVTFGENSLVIMIYLFISGINVPITSQAPFDGNRQLIVNVTLYNLTIQQEGVLEITAINQFGNASDNKSVIVVGVLIFKKWVVVKCLFRKFWISKFFIL